MKRPVRLRTTDRHGLQMIEPLDEFGQQMLAYEAWAGRQRWYRRFWIWLNSSPVERQGMEW